MAGVIVPSAWQLFMGAVGIFRFSHSPMVYHELSVWGGGVLSILKVE